MKDTSSADYGDWVNDGRGFGRETVISMKRRCCRVCGCTDNDCRRCIARTGRPCWWIEADLCSACKSGNRPSSNDSERRAA